MFRVLIVLCLKILVREGEITRVGERIHEGEIQIEEEMIVEGMILEEEKDTNLFLRFLKI